MEPGCISLYRRSAATGIFTPLFTSGLVAGRCGHPLFAGATPDESTVLLQSEAALVAPALEASESDIPPHHQGHAPTISEGQGCVFGCNLYADTGGALHLVNTLPDGSPVPSATFGGYPPTAEGAPEEELTNFSNAISVDGSRIFWTDTLPGSPEMERVYVLENGTTNVQVSGEGPAEYWTATPDGRYAYYTEGGGLFRFDTQTNEGEDLIPAAAGVEGVLGTNQTGTPGAYLYFVADGVLPSEPNSRGEIPAPGECKEVGSTCNLYLLHEGSLSFVAKLSGEDNRLRVATEGATRIGGDWHPNLGGRTAGITPDGTTLVFESIRELTGYDNLLEGNPNPEVFVYSAAGGTLSCASCNPSGAAPTNAREEHQSPGPSKLPASEEASTFIRRFGAADGARVFFNTYQPLVPQDRNGVQDVYEWERPATEGEADNTCTRADASPVTGGCTFLLSEGVSSSSSFLVDADEDGENVFFEHVGQIGPLDLPSDHNELIDARTDGGFTQTSSGCQADCLGPPAPVAEVGVAASAGFEGAGNVTPKPAKKHPPSCKKTKKKQKKKHGCTTSPKKHSSGARHAGSNGHADQHWGKK